MKKILYLAAVVAMLASCTESKTLNVSTQAEETPLRLSSAEVKTRVVDGEWVEKDAISVMMTHTGNFLSVGKPNAEYLAEDAGVKSSFNPASDEDELCYPPSGSVDIKAYYPYAEGATAQYGYPFDLREQAQDGSHSVDILYAIETNVAKSTEAVELTFNHVFSKLSITLTPGAGVTVAEITDAQITINFSREQPVTGNYTHTVVPTVSSQSVEMYCLPTSANHSVLLCPTSVGESADFSLLITTAQGKRYSVAVSDVVLTAGENLIYTVTLNEQEALLSGSIITDWDKVEGTITSVEKENDYTLADFADEHFEPAGNFWRIMDTNDDGSGNETLTKSDFENLALMLKYIEDDNAHISDPNEKRYITLVFPNLKSLPDGAFNFEEGGYDALACVSLPIATKIGDSAFYSCRYLTHVNAPLVEEVGASAFKTCTSLVELSLPAAKSIGATAFADCTSLTSLNIGYDKSGGGNHAEITFMHPHCFLILSCDKIDLMIGNSEKAENPTISFGQNTDSNLPEIIISDYTYTTSNAPQVVSSKRYTFQSITRP